LLGRNFRDGQRVESFRVVYTELKYFKVSKMLWTLGPIKFVDLKSPA